jgi:glyoxylase-like metal-dependent hydrolase (beta-lactamase superfamily II)
MILKSIHAGSFKLDGGAMFGVVPKKIWSKLIPCDDQNLCNWVMRCLFIEQGTKKILIDTGMGDKQETKFFSYYEPSRMGSIRDALVESQIDPASITDVILTHLHFDHVGGAVYYDETKQPKLSCPNANYWVNASQWQNAMRPNAREKASFLSENILPLQPFIKFVQSHKSPFDQIDLIKVDGHTEGMILPLIHLSKSKKLLYCADLFPSIYHIPLPYIMAYDMQPLITMREKEEILRMASRDNIALFFEHDISHEVALIQSTSTGKYEVKETMTLESWLRQN